MNRSLLLVLTLLAGMHGAFGEESYVRYSQSPTSSRDAALQTAVGHFSHPDHPGLEIVLYGVVHVGDLDYYKSVQKDLDSYTTVLYEMVLPGKNYKPTEDDRLFKEMQDGMGKMLGLTSQKVIDYTRKNLVHADLTMDEVKKAMGGESFSPMGGMVDKSQLRQMLPMMKSMQQLGAGMQDNLKRMMARQLATAGTKAMPGKMGKVILFDRNDAVMKVLSKQLNKTTKGEIAVFYGAAHHPDFEVRLAKLGWTKQSMRWMTAWKIGAGLEAEAGKTQEPTAPKATPAPAKPKARWF
ncbi:MAG: hypothetical protein JKY65_06555 [Planctomycetes bacterium]|nr:hypothetical protein [Planctomycetota bacterium]